MIRYPEVRWYSLAWLSRDPGHKNTDRLYPLVKLKPQTAEQKAMSDAEPLTWEEWLSR